jgi:hypothetical protein
MRIRWPSWIPAGISTSSSFVSTRAAVPAHAEHGVSTDRWPLPRQGRAGLGADELTEDAARDLLAAAPGQPHGLAGDALGARLRRPPRRRLSGVRHLRPRRALDSV